MHSVRQFLRSAAARLLPRLAAIVVVGTLVRRAWHLLQERWPGAAERAASRSVLPSLYDRHADLARAPQRRIGLRSVALEDIVGTMRHPTQNTADFLPLPQLRGENWRGRWQRISGAMDRLETLPPVELVQVGDEYYVADGHNRVAAARRAGAVEVDADVVQLVVPGMTQPGRARIGAGTLIGGESLRAAGAGRYSRTVEQRSPSDLLNREDLVRNAGPARSDRPDTDDDGDASS